MLTLSTIEEIFNSPFDWLHPLNCNVLIRPINRELLKRGLSFIDTFSYKLHLVTYLKQNKICYNDKLDNIIIPKIDKFRGTDIYINSLFHEYIHSTGHDLRLKRECLKYYRLNKKGIYINEIKEEIIAEYGAMMLMIKSEIATNETIFNSIRYIKNFLRKLDKNNQAITLDHCIREATKAVNLLLNKRGNNHV